MAKRKRLQPPAPQDAPQSAPETKGMFTEAPAGVVPPGARSRKSAPIADMAGAAAASAALEEVSTELSSAREEGRLVAKLPLDAIDPTHLMRDRVVIDSEDMAVLTASLRRRGQRTPIEVLEISPGQYGLISGWRRLSAMAKLLKETGDPRFEHIHALIRQPASAQEAYQSMVEENEVRVGLSHFERAQIVLRTVQAGVYPGVRRALTTLFATASRAKRSKIKSFMPVVEMLGDVLKFPAGIGERMGLELSQMLESHAAAADLRLALKKANIQSLDDEQSLILSFLRDYKVESKKSDKVENKTRAEPEILAPDLHMTFTGKTLKLTGAAVTPELADRVREMIRDI